MLSLNLKIETETLKIRPSDDTSKQLRKRSFYHVRLPQRYPNAVIKTYQNSIMYIYGGISIKGPTEFF